MSTSKSCCQLLSIIILEVSVRIGIGLKKQTQNPYHVIVVRIALIAASPRRSQPLQLPLIDGLLQPVDVRPQRVQRGHLRLQLALKLQPLLHLMREQSWKKGGKEDGLCMTN